LERGWYSPRRADWTDARAGDERIDRRIFSLARDFWVNVPIGLLGLYMVFRHLPDYREENTHPLDVAGLLLSGAGIGLLSYVLEVFSEHRLRGGEILGLPAVSAFLLASHGWARRARSFPCCG
jgi:hypothetical protein